jgi:hypothetical protein
MGIIQTAPRRSVLSFSLCMLVSMRMCLCTRVRFCYYPSDYALYRTYGIVPRTPGAGAGGGGTQPGGSGGRRPRGTTPCGMRGVAPAPGCVRDRSGSRVCLVHGAQSKVGITPYYKSVLARWRDDNAVTDHSAVGSTRSGFKQFCHSCVRMTSQLLRSVHRRVGTPGSAWRLDDDVVGRATWTKATGSRYCGLVGLQL